MATGEFRTHFSKYTSDFRRQRVLTPYQPCEFIGRRGGGIAAPTTFNKVLMIRGEFQMRITSREMKYCSLPR
jgi:hypothetical protein